MDPYKVLGVTPSTSDDDVKRAYRDLARKYHPDNYINNPLADLAQEKMKEINEAYDAIMRQRSGGSGNGSTSAGGQSYNYGYNGGQQQSSSGQNRAGNAMYNQIRNAISVGNIGMAEEMLQRMSTRDAEWHFLMGSVCYRKGWFDEASQEFNTACSMDPANTEYRNALNMLRMNGGYGGYRPMASDDACGCCTQLLCLNCLCNGCIGGGC